eukprot:jgi/Psemu1/42003/gm1.42003_g
MTTKPIRANSGGSPVFRVAQLHGFSWCFKCQKDDEDEEVFLKKVATGATTTTRTMCSILVPQSLPYLGSTNADHTEGAPVPKKQLFSSLLGFLKSL